MKLFEYFYAGKPVIPTPIEELKRFSEICLNWIRCRKMGKKL